MNWNLTVTSFDKIHEEEKDALTSREKELFSILFHLNANTLLTYMIAWKEYVGLPLSDPSVRTQISTDIPSFFSACQLYVYSWPVIELPLFLVVFIRYIYIHTCSLFFEIVRLYHSYPNDCAWSVYLILLLLLLVPIPLHLFCSNNTIIICTVI